jgi:8-oxo-dGTP pyrophosphatase MutT (NUDIX family)
MLPVVVRAFIFNAEWKILLTKHKKDTPWVLPGGHVEWKEDIHSAMIREIEEEFGIRAQFFDVDSEEVLHHHGKKLHHLPLPISIYDLSYTNSSGVDKSRREYIFLMETDEEIRAHQTEEIYEFAWFDPEDILIMKPNIDIYDFTLEMLEKIIGNDEDFE